MHRSGTSATAGCLSLVGFPLGIQIMEANEFNKKGYFENNLVYDFNKNLMEFLDGCWNDTLFLPDNWWNDKRVIAKQSELIELLQNDFDLTNDFVIKDPRISVLLPFYLNVFRHLNINPKVILNFRNPYEVAQSLQARNNLSLSKSMLLWIDSTLKAELYSRSLTRIFFNYDSLITDPVKSILRINELLQLNIQFTEELNVGILKFIESGLKHHAFMSKSNKNILSAYHDQLFELLKRLNLRDSDYIAEEKIEKLSQDFYNEFNFFNGLDGAFNILIKAHTDEGEMIEYASAGSAGFNKVNLFLNSEKKTNEIWIYPISQRTCLEFKNLVLKNVNQEIVQESDVSTNAEKIIENEIYFFESDIPFIKLKFNQPQYLAEIQFSIHFFSFSGSTYRSSIKGRNQIELKLNTELETIEKRNQVLQLNYQEVQQKSVIVVEEKMKELTSVNNRLTEINKEVKILEIHHNILENQIIHKDELLVEKSIELSNVQSELKNKENLLSVNSQELSLLKNELKNKENLLSVNSQELSLLKNRLNKIENSIQVNAKDIIIIKKDCDSKFQLLFSSNKSKFFSQVKRISPHNIKNSLIFLKEYHVIDKSGLFDKDFYLASYPDVKRSGINPLKHYLLYGGFENRNPSKEFSSKFYLNRNADVRKSKMNPLLHYIKYGEKEGRMMNDEVLPLSDKADDVSKQNDVEINSHESLIEVSKRVIEYWNHKGAKNKIVVYTAIVGDYDTLKIPECLNPEIDYVCFSDRYYTGYNPWEIRYIDYFDKDPTRICRYYKLNPHVLFPEYDIVIWIDAALLIRKDYDFKQSIHKHIESGKIISICKHPFRDCVFDEAEACLRFNKDMREKIEEQINYYKEYGLPSNYGLNETAILISRPQFSTTIKLFNEWWSQLLIYSKRDQLALPYVLFKLKEEYNPIFEEGYNFRNDQKYFRYFLHHNLTDKNFPTKYIYPTFKDETEKSVKISPIVKLREEKSYDKNLLNNISVDIILPVFNALTDLKLCINSVLPTLKNGIIQLIIVNDCSDEDTTNYLRGITDIVDRDKILLIENNQNLGYTISINKGLKKSKSDYKVILNSDTIVPQNWLTKIVTCGESAKEIGVVGPLSNAASWQTVPVLMDENGFKVNDLPPNVSVEQANKVCEKFDFASYPKAQLINGFCYAIKKEVIESIGYFDEETFPRGYGEEDDFSMRAQNAGFVLAIAVDTYVYHAKSKSFGKKNRNELSENAGKILKERYSHERIKGAINSMRENPFLLLARTLFLSEVEEGMTMSDQRRAGLVLETLNDNVNFRGSSYIRLLLPFKAKKKDSFLILTKWILNNNTTILPYVIQQINCNRANAESMASTLIQLSGRYILDIHYDIDDNLFINSEARKLSKEDHDNINLMFNKFETITTSTPALSGFISQVFNRKDIVTTPNKLDAAIWFQDISEANFKLRRNKSVMENSKIKVLYMGTFSHHNDLSILVPAIARIKNSYNQVEFYQIGGTKEKIENVNKIPLPIGLITYPQFVKWFIHISGDFDFALCPLESTAFTKYKSYIKYLDYSACQLPAIYSENEIYKAVIHHKQNGLLCANDTISWYENIKFMIENSELRRKMGEVAYKDVFLNHTFNKTESEFVQPRSISPNNIKNLKVSGENNIIKVEEGCNLINPTIIINGDNNIIEIEKAYRHLNLYINLKGNHKRIIIKRSLHVIHDLRINSPRGDNQSVVIEENFGCGGAEFILTDGGEHIHIGKDCLFAWDIKLRANDGHAVINLDSNKAINMAEKIVIENHCWIGEGVKIMKNSLIKSDSVVAAFSVVTKKFDQGNVVLAGIPAKIVKNNTTWDRMRAQEYNKINSTN